MRKILILSAFALLAACSRGGGQGQPAAPATPGAPADAAAALVGQTFATAFPNPRQCLGYVDGPTGHNGSTVTVIGWSWDSAAGAPADPVVLVDSSGKIVGVGHSGAPRADVRKAVPSVTMDNVGWSATTTATGALTAYGVNPASKSACRLGEAHL